MINEVENIYLKEFIDYSDLLKGYEIINTNITFDNEICVLSIKGKIDYKKGKYVSLTTGLSPEYKVIIGTEDYTEEILLKNAKYKFHLIDKLQNNELIVACARANYYGKNDYDRNAKVFDFEGNLIREFLIGDGVETLQVNDNNEIWTSYFDEGVFGNYGWNEPIGENGLICWDKNGNKLYDYKPPVGVDMICDCYALNVENKNLVWFYYYTKFPIIRLKNKNEIKVFNNCPIKGFHYFAVWRNFILCSPGYDDDKFHLLMLNQDGTITEIKKIQFFNENEKITSKSIISSRGELFYFNIDKKFLKFSIIDLIIKEKTAANIR